MVEFHAPNADGIMQRFKVGPKENDNHEPKSKVQRCAFVNLTEEELMALKRLITERNNG